MSFRRCSIVSVRSSSVVVRGSVIQRTTNNELTFDPKRRVAAGRVEDSFFKMLDARITRAGNEVMLEFFYSFCWPLRKCLDATVLEISNVAMDLMPCGRALREKAKSDALNVTADDKFARNNHGK